MAIITFTGVSPRSLGDLLKGYGLMALIGEKWPETVFWWDAAAHLCVDFPAHRDKMLLDHIGKDLPLWTDTPGQFEQVIQKSCNKKLPCPIHGRQYEKTEKKTCAYVVTPGSNPLDSQRDLDQLPTSQAELAWAVVVPRTDVQESSLGTEAGGIFPSKGQEGRGNYFANLKKGRGVAQKQGENALRWSLFRNAKPPALASPVTFSCGLLFPEAITRYASGVQLWERAETHGYPLSAWCYLLALRGALLLRGSLRRIRFARSNYPSFPFVFEGADAWEVHLPVWDDKHARTLREWRMQLAQFQVRVKGDALAANAVEFRAAIGSRGVAAAFDRFYRFALEERRPGQQRYLQQGILRGITRLGAANMIDIRLLVAPLAERRWLDRLETKRRLPQKPTLEQLQRFERRAEIERAIHSAIDEPRPETALEILSALWATNQVLARQATRGGNEDKTRNLPPVPLLDARPWERVLCSLLDESAEHRVARAISSVLGAREGDEGPTLENGGAGNNSENVKSRDATKYVGGFLWQLLPIDANHTWSKERGASVISWRGAAPERDFAELLWRRWLCSLGEGIRYFAIRGRRTAPLADVVQLLNGELDLKLIHDLVPLYALLDWRGFQRGDAEPTMDSSDTDETLGPISPVYVILRAWLHLAIYPRDDEPAERDGGILRLLAPLNAAQTSRAVSRALRRLNIRGLATTDGESRPFGKSVPKMQVEIPSGLIRRLPLALLVPINSTDTHCLARRLLVQSPNQKAMENIA